MNVGLADFVRMASLLSSPNQGGALQKQAVDESDRPLTIRVLAELAMSRGTPSEIAAALCANDQNISGTLSNLRRLGYVKPVAEVSSRTRPTFIYAITNAGVRRLNQWGNQ